LQLALSVPAVMRACMPNPERRNILLRSYAAKLINPTSSSFTWCSARPHPPQQIRPVGFRFCQLLLRLNIRLPLIIPYRLTQVAPCHIIRPICDFRLFRHAEIATTAHKYRIFFRRTSFSRSNGIYRRVIRSGFYRHCLRM